MAGAQRGAEFYWVSKGFLLGSTEFYRVFLGFPGFYWVLVGLPSFTGFLTDFY